MKQFNNKNLRRKVQKQLKELRGRVSQMAVDHGVMVNDEGLMVNGEGLMVNDEGQSLNPHPSTLVIRNSNFELRPQHSLNPHPSTLNSTEVSDEEKIVNCQSPIVKVCANERESSSLEFSQRVQPKLNYEVVNRQRKKILTQIPTKTITKTKTASGM